MPAMSQLRRQSNGADAASVAACTDTATWQLSTRPKVPERWRVTHGEYGPSLANPVSSITQLCGVISLQALRDRTLRTAVTSHGDVDTNCCNC